LNGIGVSSDDSLAVWALVPQITNTLPPKEILARFTLLPYFMMRQMPFQGLMWNSHVHTPIQGRAMSGKAARIQLTNLMFEVLNQFSQSRVISGGIVVRAKVIVLGFLKYDNQSIGKELGISARVVGKWRRRWRDSFAALLQKQFHETKAEFRRAIMECLSDAPRCGAPGTFTAEQIVGIVAIACEAPENSGRPVTS
jgi:hypothetical protein